MGAIKIINWAKRMRKRVNSFKRSSSILPMEPKSNIISKRKSSLKLNTSQKQEQTMHKSGLSKRTDSVLELSQDIEELDCKSFKDLNMSDIFADDELSEDSYTPEIKMESMRNCRNFSTDFGSILQSFESTLLDYSGEFDSRTISMSLSSLTSNTNCQFIDISRSKQCYHVLNQQDEESTRTMPSLRPVCIVLPQKYINPKQFTQNKYHSPSIISRSHPLSDISFDCIALESSPQNKSTKTEIKCHKYLLLERGPILICRTLPDKELENDFCTQTSKPQKKNKGSNFGNGFPKMESINGCSSLSQTKCYMVLEMGPVLTCPKMFVRKPFSNHETLPSELNNDFTMSASDGGLYNRTKRKKYKIEKSKTSLPASPEKLEKMLKKFLLTFGKLTSPDKSSSSDLSQADLLSLSDRFLSNLTSNSTLETFPKKSLQLIRKILYYSNHVPSIQELVFAYPLHRINITESESEEALGDPMRFEWQRIRSFHSYPTSDLGVSILHLAQNGFYYTGRGSETTCFYCKCKYSDWRLDSDVRRTHLQLSPECPVAIGRESSNVPIHPARRRENEPQQVDPFFGIDRLEENIAEDGGESRARVTQHSPVQNNSVNNHSNHGSSLPQVRDGNDVDNASSILREIEGVRLSGQGDRQRAENFSISPEGFSSTSLDASNEQVKKQRKNNESQNQRLVNSPREGRLNTSSNTETQRSSTSTAQAYKQKLSSQLDPLGIVWEKPKFPPYAILSKRISSFEGWSKDIPQSPTELSKAGYFYVGVSDYVRCFFCGGGLRNWERSDVPWEEHAKWFPRCAFLRNVKGEEYVSLVQRNSQTDDFAQATESEVPGADQNHLIFEILEEEGYPRDRIQSAINAWKQRRDRVGFKLPMKAEDLVDILEEDSESPENTCTSLSQKPEELQTLQTEFSFLQSTLLCKVCFKQEVGMAFLPCGHLVCCKECAPAVRKCILCDVIIKGTVKTYFS
ncbi:uncharacterized protein LOC133186371 [Saccostrea echinata]|uniref:uncharacterized protein LOC133186371 n=1 Tax=Saccostrea echinata TaxID=191078 RepID=UPI002A814A21|nr:uncharacterized protein LOC133186371 [Saccostrea echinata]